MNIFWAMLVISSGLWFDQSPGAESVAGVCLLLRPGPRAWRCRHSVSCQVPDPNPESLPAGYTVDLLTTFEHPVDTRPRSFEKAITLALTDIPEAGAPPPELDMASLCHRLQQDPDWLRNPPERRLFRPGLPIWSRARYWQASYWAEVPRRPGRLYETQLIWQTGQDHPEAGGDHCQRTENLAWDQAVQVVSTRI